MFLFINHSRSTNYVQLPTIQQNSRPHFRNNYRSLRSAIQAAAAAQQIPSANSDNPLTDLRARASCINVIAPIADPT